MLSPTQRYCFEVEGFLIIPGVLTAGEIAAAKAEAHTLADHPTLRQCVSDAFTSGLANIAANGMTGGVNPGVGFSLDPSSSWLGRAAPGGLFPPDQHFPDGEKRCFGIGAVWALEDTPSDTAVVVVPASHKSTLAAPDCVLSGVDTLGTTKAIKLHAGDLLLSCATLLQTLVDDAAHSASACLVHHCYLHNDAFRSAVEESGQRPEKQGQQLPQWMQKLSPEQRAVVGMRTVGQPWAAPLVKSDGRRVWTEQRPPAVDAGRGGGAVVQPPSLFSRTRGDGGSSLLDPNAAWLYDLRGYMLLSKVMSDQWLHSANLAFDAHGYDVDGIRLVPEACLRDNGHRWPANASEKLRGGSAAPGPAQAERDGAIHRPRFGGLYTLPPPHDEPFLAMIAHPPVVQALNWLLGYGYNEAFEPMACMYPPGTSGGSLHAAPRTYNLMGAAGAPPTSQAGYTQTLSPFYGGVNNSQREVDYGAAAAAAASGGAASCPLVGASTGYSLTNGRFYSEGVNVSWALDSASAADGGFVTVK
jgi:hypothetical protein